MGPCTSTVATRRPCTWLSTHQYNSHARDRNKGKETRVRALCYCPTKNQLEIPACVVRINVFTFRTLNNIIAPDQASMSGFDTPHLFRHTLTSHTMSGFDTPHLFRHTLTSHTMSGMLQCRLWPVADIDGCSSTSGTLSSAS